MPTSETPTSETPTSETPTSETLIRPPDDCPTPLPAAPQTQPDAAERLATDYRAAPLPNPDDPRETTALDLIEWILKDQWRLYRLLRNPAAPAILLPRLLAISLTGFVMFGAAMSLVMTVSGHWPSLKAIADWLAAPRGHLFEVTAIESAWGNVGPWINGKAFALIGSYAFGLIAASGICLPSLYFYGLLAGVRMTMLDVTVHAVRAKAVAATALVGILPIYVALAMGVLIFDGGDYLLKATVYLGLLLPFVAGLWGTASLYHGFLPLCDTMPADRVASRLCFLRRLVFAWSVCYSAVMPVMIYSLWEVFTRLSEMVS